MAIITKVVAREVLDSRGLPTIEVEISLDNGITERFSAPSGASTGSHEAHELRDGAANRYFGKGVLQAISRVHERIGPRLSGLDPSEQQLIDRSLIELDGTPTKSNLGANAIIATSVACAKAAASAVGLPLYDYLGNHLVGQKPKVLPTPMINIMNGGRHADNTLDIQELMIMPVGAKKLREAIQMASEVFRCLKQVLISKAYSTGVGDEGGFAPNVSSNEEAIAMIVEAIKRAGYRPREDICLALDVAASEFHNENGYTLSAESDFKERSANELVEYYLYLIDKYPIISIEDPFDENDWEGWEFGTEKLGHRVQLVGDDLFVTNIERLNKGISRRIANSIIIKPNQIGTLTETLSVVETAQNAGYTCIISNRSAETGESLLANLAVACNTGQIKAGSVCRGERTANYNELIRIEEKLGDHAVFQGRSALYSIRIRSQSMTISQ